jgi:hypothetical protein
MNCEFCGKDNANYKILLNTKTLCQRCHEMSTYTTREVAKMRKWLKENHVEEETYSGPEKEFTTNFINHFSNRTR